MKRFILNQCFFILAAAAMAVLGAQPHAYAQPAPYGQDPNGYVLTFADEFNNGFNTGVWNDHIWYDASNPTRNFAVENGRLKIWPQRDANGNFFNRTVDTDGKYYQRYGFFEIEAKLPIGKGVWPGFWIFNHIADRRPEVDIMEAYPGAGPDSGWSDSRLHPIAYEVTVWQTPLYPAAARYYRTPDLSAGFHRYGFRWEPSRMSFYFDGREVYRANVTMSDPMYILLDLWFGSASGTPDNTTPTGRANAYEINYVRAWRFR